MSRIARRCRISTEQAQQVINAAIDEMGWDEVNAYHAELIFGQNEDDAGGYILRCIGKLLGAHGRYDELASHKIALQAALTKATAKSEVE